jgi:hypothetical protein
LGFVVLALVALFSKPSVETSRRGVSTSIKLFHIILWPAVVAISLTLFQVVTNNVTLALLFPWRLSTWLVPLSVSLVAGWGIFGLFEHFRLERVSSWVLSASLVAALIFAAAGMVKFGITWQEKHSSPDRPMMTYVETNKQPSEVYLIPIKMQDFRLETGASAYVDFKSIPYKDVDVLEWYRRVQLADDFYNHSSCGTLVSLAIEGATHLVAPAELTAIECHGMELEFLDEDFGVFIIQQP